MADQREPTVNQVPREEPSHRVRLPGFISDEEIGLGDIIKRTTSYLGIHPCGRCERRAVALNRWLVFTNRKRGSA
jgi:hypothetical protein